MGRVRERRGKGREGRGEEGEGGREDKETRERGEEEGRRWSEQYGRSRALNRFSERGRIGRKREGRVWKRLARRWADYENGPRDGRSCKEGEGSGQALGEKERWTKGGSVGRVERGSEGKSVGEFVRPHIYVFLPLRWGKRSSFTYM
jgi:hypothetical protein